MPVVHNETTHGQEDNSDGEGEHEEMGDHLSPTHDSDKGGSSEDSSSDSGSEDSSEMDEEECENRRTECLDDMIDLEKQFSYLKEQLYQERITQIENKLQEVMAEQAAEYLGPLAELKEAVTVRTQVAGILRQLRLENIQTKAIAEEVAASQDFESRKALLLDSIKESLNEKIRRLEEDRNQVGLLECDSFLTKSRSLQGGFGGLSSGFRGEERESKDKDKRRKPITVTGPYIVYMLSEADILEDWTLIRKALTASKRKDYPL
uniref:EOG090X0IS7 n=1 Tax=Alona affinis TaxID=381656 RepID=A0A9N6ZDU4_9CRUS|nr:EOG090X0IS7 [Alona affinis]